MKNKSLYQFLKEENTRRITIENSLNLRLRQQEVIAWLGEYALRSRDLPAFLEEVVRLVTETLDVEFCKVLQLLPGENALLLKAGIGWEEGLVGTAIVRAGADSQAGYTLLAEEPVIVFDLEHESRFSGSELLRQHKVVSGISTIILGKEKPFGVLGAHTCQHRTFSVHDTRFLRSIANIIASAIERFEYEEALRSSRDELKIILDGISEGVTAQDPQGNIVYANEAAAKIIGYETVNELLSAPLADIRKRYILLDASGNPFPVEELPGRKVLQGEPKASARIRFRITATGEEHWSIADARPVRDPSGQAILAVNIFRDITKLVQDEQAQQLLAKTGEILTSSLDYQTTLTNIANLAVNGLADWCTVHLLTDQQEIYQLAVAHKDPARVEMALNLQRKYPPRWDVDRGIARVLHTGQAEYYPAITDEMLATTARDEEHLRAIMELGLRAAMVLPLSTRGRTLGAISLYWADSGRTYNQQDIEVAQELAHRAAMAIDNARLYQEAQITNAELEQRVAKRTAQLETSNKKLRIQVEERQKAETALRQSEALLNSLFESAPDAIILVNISGEIVRVNRQAETVFGYQREEMIGQSIDMLLPARFLVGHSLSRSRYFEKMGTRPMGAGLNIYAARKDGSEFPVDIMLSPVRTGEGNLVISAIRDMTEQKRLQTELAETHRRLFDSIEEERLMLSQELHDGPIQELYGVVYKLEDLKATVPGEEVEREVEEVEETVQGVVKSLREVCGELRPPALTHFGLEKAIRSHLIKIQEQHPEITVQAHLEKDGKVLSEPLRLTLFRVYQNSISNIIRHAQAKNITIDFHLKNNEIVLKVQDDGKGFVVPKKWVELARAGHFGLVGIAERVAWVGGKLEVTSAPGRGTTIQVIVPSVN